MAFTDYGNREKFRIVGMQDRLDEMNREALRIAREVADETGTMMAGDLCNTTAYDANDESTWEYTRKCLEEQACWATEEGADYIVGETFSFFGDEAKLAVEAMTKECKGIPFVTTMAPRLVTYDKFDVFEALRLLEQSGPAVVGFNCARGPKTMLPAIKKLREVCKGPIACLPVAFRTDDDQPYMQSLTGMETGTRAFPEDLDEWLIGRTAVRNFTKECMNIGVGLQYLGRCCGNSSHLLRTMVETAGRTPPGSKYSPSMELHPYYSESLKIPTFNRDLALKAEGKV